MQTPRPLGQGFRIDYLTDTLRVAARTEILVEQLIVTIGDSLSCRIDLTATGPLDFGLRTLRVHLVELGTQRLTALTRRQREGARISTFAV